MKRVLELIISLIATAATYALMHVVLFMDLFKFQHKLPGICTYGDSGNCRTYILFSTCYAIGRSAPETAESDRGTPFQNEFEGAFAFRYRLYCRAGSGEPHRHGIQWLWRTWHV